MDVITQDQSIDGELVRDREYCGLNALILRREEMKQWH